MDRNNPNRPEKLVSLNPRKRVRYTDPKETYDGMANPGYECVARRPHVAGVYDIMPEDRAELIEEFAKAMPDMDAY